MPTASKKKMIEPSLTEAIQHWNEFSAQNRQNALILLNAITPLKDRIQVTGELLETMQQTDWLQASTKLTDPTVLAQSFSEMADIQIAALGKLQDACNTFLQTTLASSEQLSSISQSTDDTQALLASYLETSLKILKQYQADATEEASDLSAIQSAYNAWFQKNLQALSSQ